MALESPLFQSAMELLGHSISHFNGQKELDGKRLPEVAYRQWVFSLPNAVRVYF